MTHPSPLQEDIPSSSSQDNSTSDPRYMAKPSDSYTKLAMRNMVRRRGTSLLHFSLTTLAVLGLLVGLSYIFH
jgi:hypothetical protein